MGRAVTYIYYFCQILLQDSVNLRHQNPLLGEQVLQACVRKIRTLPAHSLYQDVPIVVGVESAPKLAPSQLQYALREGCGIRQVHGMREIDGGSTYGLPKTRERTNRMVYQFQCLMMQHAVRFSADYCSIRSDPKEMRCMFLDQLRAFKFDVDPKTGEGRHHGKEAGKNDDLAVSTLMLPYWSSNFKLDDKYRYIVRSRNMYVK